MTKLELEKIAVEVRKGIITGVHSAKSGHPGGSLSAAEIFTYLYFVEMNVDPKNPKDPNRDRFVLSKGHVAPGLYATLAQKGYFPVEELKGLRHIGSMLQGHPDMKHIPGIDMSSGSLGQGFSAAVGMALAAKMDGKDYRVYSLAGDGEIQEGQIWEASMFAGARKLDNLVLFVDNNGLQIDGNIEDVCSPYPIDKKFEAFNFHVININGNDFDEIRDWAAFHHERLDGTGYPFGKTASELNTQERMMACVDIYQALTESRPYKIGMSHEKACAILTDMADKGWIDADIAADVDKCFGTALIIA